MNYPVKTVAQLRPLLQGFRKAAGLTQAMLASRLGVTQQTYAQLEADPSAVSVERLFKVLRVLEVDVVLAQTAASAAEPAVSEKRTVPSRPTKAKTPGTPAHGTSLAKQRGAAGPRKAAPKASPLTQQDAGPKRQVSKTSKAKENW
ncbi:helix-turn-helix transcriptional regulator [Paraburkholderia sp.]|uniref:helix-turn-helix domain-containing protein n=1 Tax=Paraburkholderia sp. TaxID=1926495 RepID=UPI00262F3AFE|nr:helix-turn-helix transcriptional regulator [Paraburkholderia sp.]